MSKASVNSRKGGDDVSLPIITNVDPNSPSEDAGLRAGDLVLEINGQPTNGKENSTIANLIRSAGPTIVFLVSREKVHSPEEQLKLNAKKIAQDAMAVAQTRAPDYLYHREDESSVAINQATPPSRRLSRKDSAELVANKSPSPQATPQASPQFTHVEMKMSSSKLQQDQDRPSPKSPPASPQLTPRNLSEPPSTSDHKMTASATNIGATASSPMSKRSQSSFTLPRDAPIPRLCRVRAYENQLGFTVAGSKANRGIFKVNDVSPNSPAAHSGLQNDDFIVEISGVNVESMTYNEVVTLIKAKKQEDDLQLLVADRATIQWYKSQKIPISSQVVPKMQYIETLLKEELQPETVSSEENSFNPNECKLEFML